jgi:hypothetical protein
MLAKQKQTPITADAIIRTGVTKSHKIIDVCMGVSSINLMILPRAAMPWFSFVGYFSRGPMYGFENSARGMLSHLTSGLLMTVRTGFTSDSLPLERKILRLSESLIFFGHNKGQEDLWSLRISKA